MRAWKLKLAGALAGVSLVLLGFAPADPSDDLAGPGGDGGSVGRDYNNNVEIVDAALKTKLELARVGSQRGANNLLGVFAGFRNKTGHPLALEIETIYRDGGGNALNTGSWIRLEVGARAQSDYRSSAISETAVDFLIRVRRAKSPAVASH